MITSRFCRMRSLLWYVQISQVHFLCFTPPAESSKCDNRGTVSSSSRPCSCKVWMRLFLHDEEPQAFPADGLHMCLILFVHCRTTWQELRVTSVSQASSICLRPTPKAASPASAWVSPKHAPAPLGVEIRWDT